MNIQKEKTLLLAFYRNGNDGSIGLEWGSDTRNIAIEQQLIGAVEVYLKEMKEDLRERLEYIDDETRRKFTD